MEFPQIEVELPLGGTAWREMTAEEYLNKLKWYYNEFNRLNNKEDIKREDSDYRDYLRHWFSDDNYEGYGTVAYRIFVAHRLPMARNVYLYE